MCATSACSGRRYGTGFASHRSLPTTSSDRPARYKSKRELTRAIRLIAKTDLALRSNPPTKRFVLEKLILDLTAEVKPEIPGWSQEELPV